MSRETENLDISGKSKQSMLWFTAVPLSLHIFRFINTIFLARILSPQDFGIAGLAAIVLYLSNSLTEFGFSKSIVQREKIHQYHYDSYFSFNLGMSVLLYIFFFYYAGSISVFFDMPELKSGIEVIITLFLISSLVTVPTTALKRDIRFKTLALAEAIKVCVSIVISLSLALSGFQFFSIIFAMLLSDIAAMVYLRLNSIVKPTLQLKPAYLRELSAFGVWDFLWGQSKNLFDNIDKIIIGKILDAAQLGFYDKAQSLAKMPNEQFSNRLAMISFAVFSRLQSSPRELRQYFSKIMVANSIVCFPAFVGLHLVAENLTLTLFGEKWYHMIAPLEVMSLVFLLASIAGPMVAINIALGKVRQQVIIRMVSVVVLTLCMFWVAPSGIVAASYVLLLVNIALFVATYLLLRNHIVVSIGDLAAMIFPAFLCSVILGISVEFVSYILTEARREVTLVTQIIVGGLAYLTAVFLLPFKSVVFLKQNARSMIFRALNNIRPR